MRSVPVRERVSVSSWTNDRVVPIRLLLDKIEDISLCTTAASFRRALMNVSTLGGGISVSYEIKTTLILEACGKCSDTYSVRLHRFTNIPTFALLM